MKYHIILALMLLSACGVDEQDDPKQWDTNETPQMGDQNNAQEPKTESVEQAPKVEQPTQPKPTEPKKEDPILEPSKRAFVKVYRHRDYACAIDTNNTALCDKAPPKGPTSPELLIPLELENVEQMALADHGYCVLTTFKSVDCYGYPQPILNRRLTFQQISISHDYRIQELCALGDRVEPFGQLHCIRFWGPSSSYKDLGDHQWEDYSWLGTYFTDPNTQWASIDLKHPGHSRIASACALDMQGNGHCASAQLDMIHIEGPLKQIFVHGYSFKHAHETICTLNKNQKWSCTAYGYDSNKNRHFANTTYFEGQYKRLISSVCAINTNDRVICRTSEDADPSQNKLVDPVGFAVRDFAHPQFGDHSRFEQHTTYSNWCAISKQGQMVCAQDLQTNSK